MSSVKAPTTRAVVIVLAASFLLASAGAAFAYWTSSGSGDGSATTGTSTSFTVTSIPPSGDPLVPGGNSQTVAFTVANPGTATLNLVSVVVSVANADGSAWVAIPGCSADDYMLGSPVIAYGEIAGGDSVGGTVTVTMINTTVDQDGCQGVTVPLHLVAS